MNMAPLQGGSNIKMKTTCINKSCLFLYKDRHKFGLKKKISFFSVTFNELVSPANWAERSVRTRALSLASLRSYLNNYFDFHVCLSIRGSVIPWFRVSEN